MMNRYTPVIITGLLCIITPAHATFELVPAGARPLGMAGAYIAVADDAHSPFLNPAGMSQLRYAELTSYYTMLFGLKELTQMILSGVISTPAGAGSPGFAGDGGPASQAKLDTADNISAFSNRVSVLIPLPPDTIPPAAPTEMAAFAVDGRVFLQWAANSVPDLAAYLLFREDDEQHISSVPRAQVPFSTTTFIDDEVTIGQTYFYRLAAIDSAGNQSPTSEVVQATLHLVPDHLSPNPPAMPTAEWIRGMIALHWVVNVEPDLSDYLVLRSEDNQFMLSDSLGWVSQASFADSAVAMETTYCYRLVARVYIFTDYRSKPPCCPVKWFC